ncbi:MAG: cysteine desulfurase [Persephonella sp.]|nr:MAG: cysteine desulfurase [Persephonella sp.]
MIYLDNNATTPIFPEILNKLKEWGEIFGNPSSIHSLGQKSRKEIEKARLFLSEVFQADTEEIIFNSGATEGNNTIIRGLVEAYPDKNEIIVSPIEHKSVLNPIKFLAKKGYKVKFLRIDKNGLIDLDDLKKKISKKTLFVSVIHTNNETGVIQDINAIYEICKEKEVLFFSDIVQGFLKEDIDFKKIDFFTLSGHKFNAPKGIGIMKRDKSKKLTPLLFGGGQEFSIRSGTENIIFILAIVEAIKTWLEKRDLFINHLKELKKLFIEELKKAIPNIHIVSENVKTAPHTVNIIFPNIRAQDLVLFLNKNGIYVSSGSACSSGSLSPSHVLLAYGYSEKESLSSIRFSFGVNNKIKDVYKTVEALKEGIDKLYKFGLN